MQVKNRKQLPCPICGFKRLIDANSDNKSELMAEKDIEKGWIPDYYQKCPNCKNQIGIKKVS